MYFLGIDGGGSQCRALLCDGAGNIVGRCLSGPCNPCVQSAEACFTQLQAATQGALSSNAIGIDCITAAHLGVAGAGSASARALLESVADRLFERNRTQVGISHDLKIAHFGSLVGQAGSVLVAGTGSACYSVDLEGKEALTGGWGDLIDDAGSGAWIGLRALQVSTRQADGRTPGDNLQVAVLRFLGLGSPDELKAYFHREGLSREKRAKLAPVVLKLAQAGDSAASQIVREAIGELSLLVQCCLKAIHLPEAKLVLMGGLNDSDYFRKRLAAAIRADTSSVGITEPQFDPTAGAVLLAMREAGLRPDASILDKVRASLS